MAGARPRIVALSLAAALGGCSPWAGEISCTSDPPASISFVGGARTGATAEVGYFQPLAASAGTLLGASHGIVGLELPPGAETSARGVGWVPPAELAGTTQRFRVRSDRDFCGGAAELAWTVEVLPPIRISSFEVAPGIVSARGAAVTVNATFSGGEGLLSAPIQAPLANGVPLVVPAVSASTVFHLVVRNALGVTQERDAWVTLQPAPTLEAPRAWPAPAAAGDALVLSWTRGGTITSLVLDPGAVVLPPFATSTEVVAAVGASWTLTARNDVGDEATLRFAPDVFPIPVISSLAVSPPAPAFLGSAAATAVFTGGEGRLTGPGAEDVPIASGVPVALGPFHGSVQVIVTVANPARANVRALPVGLSGPEGWALLPDLAVDGRTHHTATLLRDGRVLLAGGRTASLFLDTTWLWDPATGLAVPGPPLRHARFQHAAALLADGRVLVAGGQGDQGGATEAELLDLDAGTSAPAGDVGSAWYRPEIVSLPDGGALVRSTDPFNARSGVVLRFDPAAGSVAPLVTLEGLGFSRTVPLRDGRLLIVDGGQPAPGPSRLLDPTTGAVEETGAVLRRALELAAVALPDGRVLVLDGGTPAQVFDPGAGAFTLAGQPLAASAGPAVSLAGGDVLVPGPVSQRYDPSTGLFRETGGTLGPANRPLVRLADGTVLAVGDGWAERYTP